MAAIMNLASLEPTAISTNLKGKYVLLYGMPKFWAPIK